MYIGVLVDNEVSAIKRLKEFSNNQGESKLIPGDKYTCGSTVLRENTKCWCTWKMGLACHISGITDLLHVLKCFRYL